jgi:alkylation response protein AidB-like acyl-CoA dehydrogenase
MFREMTRNFFNTEVKPHHDQWEKDGQVSRDLWLKAGEAGLLCTSQPEEYGGSGVDILYSAVVWEEQGYANTSGPGFALHSDIVAPYFNNYGTEEQKKKYIPKVCVCVCVCTMPHA